MPALPAFALARLPVSAKNRSQMHDLLAEKERVKYVQALVLHLFKSD
jgi:hypothetical protein